jgi:glycosyltransferase involved in cell wall biosynthesis
MKVLFVNTNENYGGAARAALRIMHGVQQCGVEAQMFVKNKASQAEDVVSVLQFVPTNALYKAYNWVVEIIRKKWYQYKWHPYKRTKQNVFMSDLRGMSSHGALQKFDYDVIHLNWLNMRFFNIDELAKIKKPIVWTLHDSWAFTGICHVPYECKKYINHCGTCPMLGSKKEMDLAYEVFKKKMDAYKDLDLHIVTPSRWLGECAKLSALLGRFPVHVIPNCIDTDLYEPIDKADARKVLGLEADKKYLLFGAMNALADANKGFTYLKEALERIKGDNTELLVYGTNEDMQRFDLSIPARSLGYINNDKMMALLYNAADVTIVPSLSENLSNTIMESLSCGTPVVAFNIGGNSDMIEHKKNGYLAKEKDNWDLAKGIEWCLAHNSDGALSKKARQKVMDNFTIEIVSEQYRKLYESLV